MNKISLIFCTIISLSIVYFNFNIHTQYFSKEENTSDIIKQLSFLEKELKENNLGERMQEIYPEGYIFINALYGLAWCELALSNSNNIDIKTKAIDEALYAYNNIDTNDARWNFPTFLKPKYGVFYSGWKNYLLSKIFCVSIEFKGSAIYYDKLKHKSDQIANAFDSINNPFLESYAMSSWPADNFIAINSLANYDKVFKNRYKSTIRNWLSRVDLLLDKKTEMVPHKVNFETGKTIEGARGSSSVLIIRMLDEINHEYGKKKYQLLKKHFITTTFGLPSIREYPKGDFGIGDIDSGPVLFGVGFAATIVGINTIAAYQNYPESLYQYSTINSFGFSTTTENQKLYLYGKLPIADAFIAWGRASSAKTNNTEINYFWALKFHFYSFIIISILWVFYFRKKIKSLQITS